MRLTRLKGVNDAQTLVDEVFYRRLDNRLPVGACGGVTGNALFGWGGQTRSGIGKAGNRGA